MQSAAFGWPSAARRNALDLVGGALAGLLLVRLGAVVAARLDDGVTAREPARLGEVALLHQDVDLQIDELLEGRTAPEQRPLDERRRPPEEELGRLGLRGENGVQLAQRVIVVADARGERRHAIA